MLLGKGGCGAEQARLGVSDELHRYRLHHRPETPFCRETLGKARMYQMIFEPQPQSACDDDALRPLRQSEIARYCAEAEAEAIECGECETVFALERHQPDRL